MYHPLSQILVLWFNGLLKAEILNIFLFAEQLFSLLKR